MTPGARVAAAIEILDQFMAGTAAEQALTAWARRSRFAGSKDRAAVRDHVFDVLRNLQGFQALGGEGGWPPTGRALMIGAMRAADADLDADLSEIFSGSGYAPAPLTSEEDARGGSAVEVWNLPDWLAEEFVATLGPDHAADQARMLAHRAPVTLRANSARISRAELRRLLEEEGVALRDNPLAPDALTVTGKSRGLTGTNAYRDGLFEMQDAASQAVIAALDVPEQGRILDFCAGGGGKSLAMAARTGARITAHDADPPRMKDLPARAARAGARIDIEPDTGALERGTYDLVLLDVPCSGSGSWRRTPEAKWLMSHERLDQLCALQREILGRARDLVAPGGVLAYVTCSILPAENRAQCTWFVENYADWVLLRDRSWPVSHDGDGFFLAEFTRR